METQNKETSKEPMMVRTILKREFWYEGEFYSYVIKTENNKTSKFLFKNDEKIYSSDPEYTGSNDALKIVHFIERWWGT